MASDPDPTTNSPTGQPTSGATSDGPPAEGITSTADVPVGGGVVIPESTVVVTQPAEGEFKCFTAVCTHEGCLVSSVTETINCPCHGSQYDISTGEVVGGPAPAALAAVDFAVDGDQIVLG